MAQLVHDDAELVAILANRNRLRTVATLADEGAAPVIWANVTRVVC